MSQGLIGGRFRITQVIDAGNMGEVHRAEDLQAPEGTPERAVAVKLILRRRSGALIDTAADAKAVQRFAREVRIMRRLDHPNLTRLIDGGVDEARGDQAPGGLPYLAMELLDGETLRDLIAEEQQLPIAWAVAIAAQIASGLAAAHTAGIVHRDLKPANVMLTRGGTVKVLDFGMGRIVDDPDEARLTSTGVTVGTARYMAPEQFEARQVTQAADLYALGCVLHEMLVGVPPFTSESAYELARKHVGDAPTPVRVIRSEVPAELARLVERLLAKDPSARPADAVAVRDALLPLVGEDGGAPRLPHWSALDPTRSLREAGAPAPVEPPNAREPSPVTASGTGMDVFGVHRELIKDYRSFTEGGTVIRDDRIAAFVEDDLNAKSQWPDPWLSLNPFFAGGGTVLELAGQGVLHEECARIFQAGKTERGTVCDGRPLTLHQHQRKAVDAARSGASYVLTTGTGSGKSLSYIVPIVNKVLQERDAAGPGAAKKHVRAIIVYPMNALANSQLKELEKYLRDGYGAGREPVTFDRYTGQEDDERRRQIRDNPPDILLTNYVMLELMLTRPADRAGRRARLRTSSASAPRPPCRRRARSTTRRRSSQRWRARSSVRRSAPSTSSARPWSVRPTRRPRPSRPSGSPLRLPRARTPISYATRWRAGSRPVSAWPRTRPQGAWRVSGPRGSRSPRRSWPSSPGSARRSASPRSAQPWRRVRRPGIR